MFVNLFTEAQNILQALDLFTKNSLITDYFSPINTKKLKYNTVHTNVRWF